MSVFLLLITASATVLVYSASAATTNYAGLVFSGEPNTSEKSGDFVLYVSANRKISGRMLIDTRGVGFSGRFDTNGAADVVVKIAVDNSCYGCDPPYYDIETHSLWNVHFQLSAGGESVSGTVHFRNGGFPDGTVFGKRSSFNGNNQVPLPGNFTFVFAGSVDPANTNFPAGNGFGTINIKASGAVEIAGTLADNVAFSQGTLLCDDGTFPVFDTLYNAKGMIQGWVGLTNSPATEIAGHVNWVKPDFAGRTFYPAGFTNDVPVAGTRYAKTKPILNWTNGVVIFSGGKLTAPFTNTIVLNGKGNVVNLSDNKLSLKIQPGSGRFNGSLNEPITGERISFKGVLLQTENGGSGFFPDAPLSGQVMLGPAAP